ncbi:MAG: hypothetical protein R2788_07405 [Saprospiraceae bacterium]
MFTKAAFTNQNGCTFTTPSVAIDVVGTPNATVEAVVYNENGQVGAVYQTNFTACEGDDVNLQVNGLRSYTYQWPNGSTGTEISFSENTNNGLIRGGHVFTRHGDRWDYWLFQFGQYQCGGFPCPSCSNSEQSSGYYL